MALTIKVQAKPNSKIEGVEVKPDGVYVVRVRARAVENQANERICEVLAEHFGVAKSKVNLSKGLKGKLKTFVVDR